MGNEEHIQPFPTSHFSHGFRTWSRFFCFNYFYAVTKPEVSYFDIYFWNIITNKINYREFRFTYNFFPWNLVQIFLANFCISHDYFFSGLLFFDFKYSFSYLQDTYFISNGINLCKFMPKPKIRPKFSMIFEKTLDS